mgnify:FL=1
MNKRCQRCQRCHICLEDFKFKKSIKSCCDAYICKDCIYKLFKNDFNKCPICRQNLDIETGNKCLCNLKPKVNCNCEKILYYIDIIFTNFIIISLYLILFYLTGYIIYDKNGIQYDFISNFMNLLIGILFYILIIISCMFYIHCCNCCN